MLFEKNPTPGQVIGAIEDVAANEGGGGGGGVTFTPDVSADGTLSWTNNGGLENPQPVNLTGPAGPTGADGAAGFSPIIAENADNTDATFRLDVTDAGGTVTTPNLKAVHTVSNAEVYSTEETVIGTWIDGKPLYRKVIPITIPAVANTNTTVYTGDHSNCALVNRYGVIGTTAGNLDYYYSSSNYMCVYGSMSEIRMILGADAVKSYGGRSSHIILEYTKTTDEATIAVATVDELNAAYAEGVQSA